MKIFFLLFSHHQNYLSQEALLRTLNLRAEDLFFFFDADEIPKPEVTLIRP
jgi:hypothetical protein